MTKPLKLEVLPAEQSSLFRVLANSTWLKDYYLAGGTALALQLGHRQSIDFDFFCQASINTTRIKHQLREVGTLEMFSEDKDTINAAVNGILLSFFHYETPLLNDVLKYNTVSIASLLDIALMKIAAISGRGSKKDFIDLYFLLDQFSLGHLFEKFEIKFGKGSTNTYHLLKSLVYFEDAENQPSPVLLKKISWTKVKQSIVDQVKKYNLVK